MASNSPTRMRAIGWSKGSTAGPSLLEMEAPLPARDQLRVRVACSALNPADLKVSSGKLAGRFLHARVSPLVTGYDFSGTVERCGEDIDDFKVGDEVFGFLRYSASTQQGTCAELITVDRPTVARKPAGLSHEQAAAAATAGLTALQSLRDLGRVREGSRVMIVGAAGGVGSLALGVAKKLGAHVVAICSTYAADFVRELGADEVVDRRKQDPLAMVGPFDVVFDAAAAQGYFACRHQLTKSGSYITTLPSPGVFLGKLASVFSSRRCEFIVVKSLAKDLELLATWIVAGMRVPIAARYPVRELGQALDLLSKGGVCGRIAIQVENGF